MNNPVFKIAACTLFTTFCLQAHADVPSCYVEDQKDIQDGKYSVTFTTDGKSAKDYATVLNFAEFGQSSISTDANIKFDGDGADLSGETIEMSLSATTETQYNQLVNGRAGATPFSQVKTGTLAFLNALNKKAGVTSIKCVTNVPVKPLKDK